MDGMKTLHIGVAPPGYVKRRMMEIARGGKLLPGEPKLWVSWLWIGIRLERCWRAGMMRAAWSMR